MKHNDNHANGHNAGLQLMPILFEFSHPRAITICVAGTLNRWQSEAKTLLPTGGRHWWKELASAPGTYEHCLVMDGQWIPDPSSRETMPNTFGG
ncbi:MAG TPA: glycogen-binding domain-containing protein [Candidatus Baltobacteraceae bacterium]|jgi:hypothetical protein|nr:glycogen-binding domain-containing protein [Candidatus Baltobacteraceae bacterium]